MVIQVSTDLKTWIPLQTNLLGSNPLYFSDPQSTTNLVRYCRAFALTGYATAEPHFHPTS